MSDALAEPKSGRTLLATVAVVGLFLFATLPASAVDTELQLINVAPIVVDVTLPSTISPLAGTTQSVSSTILVEDLNGCSDIDTVMVTVEDPDGGAHIAATAATFQSCTLGTTATYTYAFDMNYHDAPALGSNHYKVKVVATDSKGATGNNLLDLALFNFEELVALNVSSGALDFGGPLNPGDQSSIVSLPLTNHGNVAINTELSGTDLAHETEEVSIPASAAAYSDASNMDGSSALTTSPAALALGITPGASSSEPVYWQLSVPSGEDQWVPSGQYTGSLTVSAVKAT